MKKSDVQALKGELSLDLVPLFAKTSYNQLDVASTGSADVAASQPLQQQQQQQFMLSPNNSVFTDNTSQSVTPSEFGYQSLQRPISMHSLLETEDNSLTYKDYENTPSNQESPLSTQKLLSPMQKSTISITYNLRSQKKDLDDSASEQGLVENTLDENSLNEQMNVLRNSVSEVNEFLHEQAKEQTAPEHVDKLLDKKMRSNNEVDIQMLEVLDTPLDAELAAENEEEKRQTMLEDQDKLLYENVQLRRPNNVYANVLVSQRAKRESVSDELSTHKLELDSLEAAKTSDEQVETSTTTNALPVNFSVKELATKFESSTVEPLLTLEQRSSLRKNNEEVASVQLKPQLKKAQQITRSLDEHAFYREFGARKPHELVTRSVVQLPGESLEMANHRRKSFDFTRPKTLNPPKRLAGLPMAKENYALNKPSAEQQQVDNNGVRSKRLTHNATEVEDHDYEVSETEIKMTPNIENRLSVTKTASNSELNNSYLLCGVKLDRERIDRIKEERRQQLIQKYGFNNSVQNLKSHSKTDLNASLIADDDTKIQAEEMRVKSKSRGDMRQLQHDMDNLKGYGRASLCAEQRMRRPDTKNADVEVVGENKGLTHKMANNEDKVAENAGRVKDVHELCHKIARADGEICALLSTGRGSVTST